jgi:hypothetical protein
VTRLASPRAGEVARPTAAVAGTPEEATETTDVRARLDRLDWQGIERGLRERGYATARGALRPEECEALIALYGDDALFRKTIDMAARRFGEGEYRYFAYPLPPLVEALRREAYPRLAPIANSWMRALGERARYPASLARFLARCRRAGQTRPTPLLLRYEAGGYNCLHQDLYGALAFPLQIAFALSRRGGDHLDGDHTGGEYAGGDYAADDHVDGDYTGGDFLLVEQRPRAQSIGHAVPLECGEMIVFTNSVRPAHGARGHYRVNVRHGVSPLLSGTRYTLGVIFHDAE